MANVANAPATQAEATAKNKKKDKAEKRPKEKKAMTPFRAVLLTLIFVLFLGAAGTALVWFNLFNAKQIAVDFLLAGESPYKPQIARLEELSEGIALESLKLEETRADLEKREAQLAKAQSDLAAKTKALDERDTQLIQRTTTLEDAEANMTQLIAMYERMEAAKAAKIMQEVYDVDDVARLLSRMKSDRASAILAAMDAERAARVTELLLE